LVWARLEAAADGYGCPACFATYPVVDGVPIVLRDTDGWLASVAVCGPRAVGCGWGLTGTAG